MMKTQIRSQTINLSAPMRERARERVTHALERFADRVHSVVVRIDDLNGPRGGVDKSCRIKIQGPRYSIVLEQRHSDPHQALVRALRRAAHTLTRRFELKGGRAPRQLQGTVRA